MTPIPSSRWSIGDEVVLVNCYGEKPTKVKVIGYVGPFSLLLQDGNRQATAATSLIRTSPPL